MRNTVTQDINKKLYYLATKLPVVMNQTHEVHIMTKEELEKFGYVGAEKLADGNWRYKMPVQIATNHYSCLKSAYQKHGLAGVNKYIDDVLKLPNREDATLNKMPYEEPLTEEKKRSIWVRIKDHIGF